MRREMNILAMAKGPERYIFLYDDQSYQTLIDVMAKFAHDPNLSFCSDDAAVLCRKAMESKDRSTLNRPLKRNLQ
jgi:hypothetical protein